MESWFLLQSGLGPADLNMATDEALLERATTLSRPVLRFYGWSEPAASFGYFQHFSDVSQWTNLRPLVRRPTGGGLVPHDDDWTYCLAFPPTHSWFRLKAVQSYQAVHGWIHRAFAALGLITRLAPSASKGAPGQCFIGAERFDLLRDGVKIAGAAQRRNRLGLLIQGSIQARGCSCGRSDWEQAMLETALFPEKVQWLACPDQDALNTRAASLARDKYSQTWYNERR